MNFVVVVESGGRIVVNAYEANMVNRVNGANEANGTNEANELISISPVSILINFPISCNSATNVWNWTYLVPCLICNSIAHDEQNVFRQSWHTILIERNLNASPHSLFCEEKRKTQIFQSKNEHMFSFGTFSSATFVTTSIQRCPLNP